MDDIRKRNRLFEDKWGCKAGAILIYLNAITPIILRGHNLSTEKVQKQPRKEIPQSKKNKSNLCPHQRTPWPEVILVLKIWGWRKVQWKSSADIKTYVKRKKWYADEEFEAKKRNLVKTSLLLLSFFQVDQLLNPSWGCLYYSKFFLCNSKKVWRKDYPQITLEISTW